MSFAKNLQDARIRMNYSSKELAQKIGISATTYSNYELGLREPKFDILIKIATVLNVSTDKLLDVDNTARNEFYLEQGIEIMKELGFFKVLNPFDYYDYGAFDLCFARTGSEKFWYLPTKQELTTFVAFKKSHFINLVEDADIHAPNKPIKDAPKDLLLKYIFDFLSFEGPYNEWLDDLDSIHDMNRAIHPEEWEEYQKHNVMRGDQLLKHLEEAKEYITRADADFIIKTKMDMSYLYNTDLSIYSEDPINPD